jgi:uncharacterized repeat protein (TIGR03803 family)
MKRHTYSFIVVIALVVGIASVAAGQTEVVLHNFTVMPHGKNPQVNLIADAAGNFYGVTPGGGSYGYGVVFKLSLSAGKWTQTVLYNFTGGSDGSYPLGPLVFDKAGNLYGEAQGGLTTCYEGCGVVYRLSPNTNGTWTETVIYNFLGGTDSAVVYGALIFDSAGNLYGVGDGGLHGEGTIFELSPNTQGQWTETILYNFTGLGDGANPDGALTFDAAGNLYGTAVHGGDPNCAYDQDDNSCGVVFKLANNGDGTWTQSTLLQFEGLNGAYPSGNVVIDAAGNLYGVTSNGPGYGCYFGCGTFFRLSPNSDGGWTYSLLYTFAGGPDAESPNGGLMEDSQGNFYGTSVGGGITGCSGYGCGTVFEISPSSGKIWKEKILYRFSNVGFVGENPLAGLLEDSTGNLYGTAYYGGVDCISYNLGCAGTIFELSPASGKWTANSLYQFSPGSDGLDPFNAPVLDGAGNLYLSTALGGNYSCGTQSCGGVFEFSPLANGAYSEHGIYDFTSINYELQYVSSFILDSSGNLYGTAEYAGTGSCSTDVGCGTVFELSPAANGAWQQTVLYNFQNDKDGEFPTAALTFDAAGNLYGTTTGGPNPDGCCGTVFELTPGSNGQWAKKILYAFSGTIDGNQPNSTLVFDSAGNLYGTTELGGAFTQGCGIYAGANGCGTVFKLSPNLSGGWTESVVHAFTGHPDGAHPNAVTIDSDGNLYGTTALGGKDSATYCSGGCGTVFELSRAAGSWAKTTLYSFQPYEMIGDGAEPRAGVAIGADGSLYGTTATGGLASNTPSNCCGTVYSLTKAPGGEWIEKVLYAFDTLHGVNPTTPVIVDPSGNLFGTTAYGGADGGGVLYEINMSKTAQLTQASLAQTSLNQTSPRPPSTVPTSPPFLTGPWLSPRSWRHPSQANRNRNQRFINPNLPNAPQNGRAQ